MTKRGKVVAHLIPVESNGSQRVYAKAGFERGEMEIVGDIMEPVDVMWDAML